MITESTLAPNTNTTPQHPQQRHFKIIKQAPQHLILTDGKNNMIFKTYLIPHNNSRQHLEQRQTLSHPSLLNIHKIQLQKTTNNTTGTNKNNLNYANCGILFEKYQKTLTQSFKEMNNFTHEEIFQTMRPIKQVLDYLVAQNYDPGHISSDSIVCTEHYEVKLMDSYLHDQILLITQRPEFKTVIFEEFVALLFSLLFPQQKHIKSWKSRYELAQKRLKGPDLKYLQQLSQKFLPEHFNSQKSKKIKKSSENSNKEILCKRSKRLKIKELRQQENIQWQEGKQNKIIQ